MGGMDDLPEIRKDVAGPNALQTMNNAPSFFGVNPNDTNPGATNVRQSNFTETFQSSAAPFVNVIGDDST